MMGYPLAVTKSRISQLIRTGWSLTISCIILIQSVVLTFFPHGLSLWGILSQLMYSVKIWCHKPYPRVPSKIHHFVQLFILFFMGIQQRHEWYYAAVYFSRWCTRMLNVKFLMKYCIHHIFREGFIFANFASLVLFANSTIRKNKFTSDPDARMWLVYAQY